MLTDTVRNSSPFVKFIFFCFTALASVIGCMLVGVLCSILAVGVDNFTGAITSLNLENPTVLAVQKIIQAAYSVGLFLLPPVLFALLLGEKITSYLKLKKTPQLKILLYAAVLIVAAIPLNNFLYSLNKGFPFPDGLATWIEGMEKNAEAATRAFLAGSGLTDYLINLTLIAIIPALGEEFLFRGVIQHHLSKVVKHVHVAVILTAVLFSAMHMQFYGFLPRFVLGLVMGYLYVWSNNLWVPITAHFVNNGFTVTMLYYGQDLWKDKLETMGSVEHDQARAALFSFMLVAVMLYAIYLSCQKEKEKNKLDVN